MSVSIRLALTSMQMENGLKMHPPSNCSVAALGTCSCLPFDLPFLGPASSELLSKGLSLCTESRERRLEKVVLACADCLLLGNSTLTSTCPSPRLYSSVQFPLPNCYW